MRKLYEIFKLFWIQKRIVAAAFIWGNNDNWFFSCSQGSSVEFERIEEPTTLKSVIGREFFNTILSKLTLEVDENHCVLIEDTTLRLNSDGHLVFGENNSTKMTTG